MSQIHILDGQKDIILDYITADFIIEDNHEKSLENTLETYDFRTFADKRFSQFLEKRNRIIIPDEDESLREFIIFEAHRYRDSEGHKSQVFAHASYLELKKASIIYPNTFTGTPSQHGGRALNDTGWQIGIVEVTGNRKIAINEYTNPYEVIKRIAKEFGAELRFRIEHDGNKVIGRYVDLLERVGVWRGREVEFGKDLDGIRRVEKQDVVTALLGLGPDKEDGTRLEVLEEDEDALQRWGRIDENGDLKHLIEAYEIQSDRTEMTEEQARQYTRTALNKRINTQVTFETTIVDLESVAGMENKKIRFGDTIKIKDEKFNPPLYLEARVFEMNRSIKRKDKTDIKLGDYIEHTEEQVNAIWSQLQDEIRKRFERMVIANIDSNGGDVFKNGIGSTELFVRTFVGGAEVDEDGAKYDYQWMKFDMDGNHVTDFYDSGKTLMVYATDIEEKATYRVLISIDLDVVNITEITLSNVFDGSDGDEGAPGKAGADGKTPYFHTAWANNATGTSGFSTTVSADKLYIGTYTDFTQADSNDPEKYKWTKIKGDKGDKGDKGAQGIQGPPGANGTSQYVHIRYSANSNGNPMTTTPQSNTQYVGLANTTSATAPTGYASYAWAKFKGEQGNQGIPGAPGSNGQTTYTWVKYADNAQGSGMSDSPDGKLYIGLAFNKTTAAESNNANDYDWSMMPQNIEVGGTNLLLNTSSSPRNFSFAGWNQKIADISEQGLALLSEGGDFILSVKVSEHTVGSTILGTILQTFDSGGGFNQYQSQSTWLDPKKTGWIVTYFKGIYPDKVSRGQVNLRHHVADAPTSSGKYHSAKLSSGNVATDWTPAPEDAEKAIQDVKTTADGKNSIFYATAQPATAGRKIGDVWFKTNADNKMYRFNGSTWVEALIGEQAIVANSITANHIKSLFGLNVNDQFIVDNNGNVSFKGNLTGATGTFSGALSGASGSFKGDVSGSTGTFGQVTVNEGDLTVKDAASNVKALVTPLPNLLGDHNFELLMVNWMDVSDTINWAGFVTRAAVADDYSVHKPYWVASGNPRVAITAGDYGNTDHRAQPIFGSQAIVIRNAHFVHQSISDGLGKGGTYTVSGYFKRQWGQAAGTPLIEVDHRRGANLVARLISNAYTKVPDDYSVIRYATSFTLPSNFQSGDHVSVKISGSNANWIQADGIQLVKSPIPTVYDPEISAFDAISKFDNYPYQIWDGGYAMTATHTVKPRIPLSQCDNGWKLRFQAYTAGGGVQNYDYQDMYIAKDQLSLGGAGRRFIGARGTSVVIKYLYFSDTQIRGYADNNSDLVLTGVFTW